MGAKRFSSIGADGNYTFGVSAPPNNPELLALVSTAIAGWSFVQANLGNTFAAMIGAKKPVVMSMYESFDTFAPQRQLLRTVANEVLPETYRPIFHATLKVLHGPSKERHRFAHWCWGFSTDPKFSEKVLLLANPKDLWRLRIARYRHYKAFKKFKGNRALGPYVTQPNLDPSLIYAYREKDLKEVCASMDRAWEQSQALAELVAKPALRRATRRRLLSQPEIRRAHDKILQIGEEDP